MKVRTLLAALAAVVAVPAALAQALGSVTTVNGVATVLTGGTATTLTPGMTLMHGSRIVTTSSSSVTLRMNSGCTITVPPAHAITLLSTQTCPQLQAALQPVGPAASTAVMGQAGFGGMNPAVAIWGAGIAGFAIYDVARDENGVAPTPPAPQNPDETPISGR